MFFIFSPYPAKINHLKRNNKNVKKVAAHITKTTARKVAIKGAISGMASHTQSMSASPVNFITHSITVMRVATI